MLALMKKIALKDAARFGHQRVMALRVISQLRVSKASWARSRWQLLQPRRWGSVCWCSLLSSGALPQEAGKMLAAQGLFCFLASH